MENKREREKKCKITEQVMKEKRIRKHEKEEKKAVLQVLIYLNGCQILIY